MMFLHVGLVDVTGTTAVLGERHVVTCSVNSSEPYFYVWTRRNHVLQNSTNSTYLFSSVAILDAGRNYQCIVQYKGVTINSTYWELNVTSK